MQPTGPRRSSALAAAGAVGLATAVVALVVLVSSTGSVRPVGESTARRTPSIRTISPQATPSQPVASPGARIDPIDLPGWITISLKFLGMALAAAVVCGLAYLVLRLVYRFVRQLRLPEVELDSTDDWERVATERLADAVDVGLSRMDSGWAADAIVACWVALEQTAASAGVPREPAETPAEFTVRVLALGNVSADALTELAELYREARFSTHESSEDDRQRARTALERLREELVGAS